MAKVMKKFHFLGSPSLRKSATITTCYQALLCVLIPGTLVVDEMISCYRGVFHSYPHSISTAGKDDHRESQYHNHSPYTHLVFKLKCSFDQQSQPQFTLTVCCRTIWICFHLILIIWCLVLAFSHSFSRHYISIRLSLLQYLSQAKVPYLTRTCIHKRVTMGCKAITYCSFGGFQLFPSLL